MLSGVTIPAIIFPEGGTFAWVGVGRPLALNRTAATTLLPPKREVACRTLRLLDALGDKTIRSLL